MKYLLIDLRKSDEVFSKHIEYSDDHSVYNIPANMIRFNRDMIIKHLEYADKIYIVSNTERRAQYIKDKYFINYDNIIVNEDIQFLKLNHGENEIILEEGVMKLNIIGSNAFNMYSIEKVIQLILGTLIIGLGGYTYYQMTKKKVTKTINKIPLIVLILVGVMTLINSVTKTYTLSILLQDYLN